MGYDDNVVNSSNVAPLSDAQYLLVWGIGSISCAFSWFGSLSIIYIASRKIRCNLYHRLLFIVSGIDVLSTVVGFFAPILMNAETGDILSHGNQGSCTFVGVIIMFGVISKAFYTFYIALYFMLSVRYSWTDNQLVRYERYAYIIAFIIPMSYIMAGLINEAFNPNEFRFCCLAKYPIGCAGEDCIRGEIARTF
jgi:hypothetical protein